MPASSSEHPRARLTRMFNMGTYGEKLALEILLDYRDLVADFLRDNGESYAADLIMDSDFDA